MDTISPPPKPDPAPEPSDGYLDHVVSIFQKHDHPIVVIEEYGLNWMGLRCMGMQNLDLLIRDSQLQAISDSLLSSGWFELVEQNLELRLYDEYTLQVPRFHDISPFPKFEFQWINLWSESVYMLQLDNAELTKIPDIVTRNMHLRDERFATIPETKGITIEGYHADIPGLKFLPKYRFSSNPDVEVFMPSIPRTCEALLRQHSARPNGWRAGYHLSNFVRYLYFDRPAQMDIVLSLVGSEYQEHMKKIILKFKRKRRLIQQEDGTWAMVPG
ncbi:hypothetical protein ABW19_dt0204526 [Dactylella cylindrospora]|nr:hypothetical protein ABW19_dt0204526 [Dactylella cylindrospora]